MEWKIENVIELASYKSRQLYYNSTIGTLYINSSIYFYTISDYFKTTPKEPIYSLINKPDDVISTDFTDAEVFFIHFVNYCKYLNISLIQPIEKLTVAIDTTKFFEDYQEARALLNSVGQEAILDVYSNTERYVKIRKENSNEEILISLLDSIYPGKYSKTGQNVIIHWDRVTITNSQGSSHVMHDFYIELKFESDFLRLREMRGLRASFTLKEYWNTNPYTFSHLSTGEFGRWGYLCLGHTALSNMYTYLRSGEGTSMILEAFLLQLDSYVRWESREGGPYRGSNIGKITYRSSAPSGPSLYIPAKYYNYLPHGKKLVQALAPILELKVESRLNKFTNNLSIVKTDLLERALFRYWDKTGLIDKHFPADRNFGIYYKDISSGEYFSKTELQLRNSDELTKIYYSVKESMPEKFPNVLFEFQGKPVKVQLLPEDFETKKDKIDVSDSEVLKGYIQVLPPAITTGIINGINEALDILITDKLNNLNTELKDDTNTSTTHFEAQPVAS